MLDLWQIVEKLNGLSSAAMLTLVLIGGYRKWWCWGHQLAECEIRAAVLVTIAEKRENEWKELALSGGAVARTAVEVLKQRNGPGGDK